MGHRQRESSTATTTARAFRRRFSLRVCSQRASTTTRASHPRGSPFGVAGNGSRRWRRRWQELHAPAALPSGQQATGVINSNDDGNSLTPPWLLPLGTQATGVDDGGDGSMLPSLRLFLQDRPEACRPCVQRYRWIDSDSSAILKLPHLPWS